VTPAGRFGTAAHLAVGLGVLPASVLFGLIWDRAGAPTAFASGAALALAASAAMVVVAPRGNTS
jgi:hypothetical protein